MHFHHATSVLASCNMHFRMNWRDIGFNWNRARAFLVAAEEGSLSAAARALGVAQPTLGRQVDALEQELGVALFERVGRGLTLTPTGLSLLEHIREMADAAGRVSLAASGRSQSIEGKISLTASQGIAAFLLPPILTELRREQPGIEIELLASNVPLDLRRRETDIAIRNFRPTQPDLVAKKICDAEAVLYAAPEYLQRLGNPTTADALSEAAFIAFGHGREYMDGLNALGLSLTRDSFPIVSEDHLVGWEMVKHGAGIGIAMAVIGDAEPRVVRALPGLSSFPVPVWLTTHREVHTSLRVRTVYDFVATQLSDALGTSAQSG